MPRRAAPALFSLQSRLSLYRRQRRLRTPTTTRPTTVYLEGRLPALLSGLFWAWPSSQPLFLGSWSTGGGEVAARMAVSSTNHRPLVRVLRHHRWDQLVRRLGLRFCLGEGLRECRLSRAIPATRHHATLPWEIRLARLPEPRPRIVEAGGGAMTILRQMDSARAHPNGAQPACSDPRRPC
jgi:hypothetical protein